MRKRTSKRRWKARYRLGQWIPLEAILNHRLERLVRDAELHPGGAAMYRRPEPPIAAFWRSVCELDNAAGPVDARLTDQQSEQLLEWLRKMRGVPHRHGLASLLVSDNSP